MISTPRMEKLVMGTFLVSMTVANPNTGSSATVEAVVDTGATLTSLPPSLVEELGIEQEDTARVQLADGSLRDIALGTARLTVEEDRTRTTPVLFAPSEDAPVLLGAVTLESMGFALDPVGQRLVPRELLLL